MFFGILNALIGSIGAIVYKISLSLSNNVLSNKVYQFLGSFFTLIIVLIFVFFDLGSLNLIIFGILLFISIFGIIAEFFEQFAYKNEKISVLLPYAEFETIIAVVFGFFLFGDNSLISFVFALLAGITLIVGSIDFKKVKFNKYCLALIGSAFLEAIKILLYGYLLIYLAPIGILFYDSIISFGLLLVLLLIKKEFFGLFRNKNITKKMLKFIFMEAILTFLTFLISLYLIKELGIVQSVLIGMFYLGFSLLIAYFYLNEKPEKKDLILVVIVSIFISGGLLFG